MIREIIELDKNLLMFLNNLGVDFWDPFWLFLSNEVYMFLFITTVALFYCHKYDGKKAVYTIFLLVICFGLTDLIHVHLFKNLFMRLRPCHETGVCENIRFLVDCSGYYGFVSGHAANSMAIISFLILYFRSMHKFIKYGLVFWVLLVSYSRIYLGKHYILDVLCGIILGFLIAFFCYKIYRVYIEPKILKS